MENEQILEAFVCPKCGQSGWIIENEYGLQQYEVITDGAGGIEIGDQIHSDMDVTQFKCGACHNEIEAAFQFQCDGCNSVHEAGDTFTDISCLESYLKKLAEKENGEEND